MFHDQYDIRIILVFGLCVRNNILPIKSLSRCAQVSKPLKISALALTLVVALPQASSWAQSGEASELEARIFEQVFSDPTNLLLNFKLAGAQLQNGNVKGAIGTLERVLTLDPENNEAQFLIANAHLRLGNNVDARRMLALLLENPKASDVERQQAEMILANLDRQQRRFFITGSVSAGGGIADNPEGGSIGNIALVAGSIGEVTDKRANTEDYFSTAANVNFTAKLESQREETVSIGLATSLKDYGQYDAGDLAILSANTRYMRGLDQGMLAATLNTARIHVGDQHYLNSYGAQLNYSQTFFERWNTNVNLGVTRSVFKKSFSSTNAEKTSLKTEGSVRLARAFQKFQLGTSFKLSGTDAREDKNSKDSMGMSAFVSANILPGITTVTYDIDHTDHDAADTNYGNDAREDRRHSMGLSHVIGLSSLNLPVGNEPRLSFNANYGKTKSNIANFSKYSGDVSLTLIKPF